MSAKDKLKGAALALLWLLTMILILVWDQNVVSIVASALGVAATLLVVFGLGWWRAVAALASALFVVNWALAFVRFDIGGSPFETYVSVITRAIESGGTFNAAVVLGYEVALPVVHLVVALALTVRLVRYK